MTVALNERPAHRLPHGQQTGLAQATVIFIGAQIMPGGGNLIYPLTVPVVAGGPFKAGLKEASEQCHNWNCRLSYFAVGLAPVIFL